VFGEVMAGSLEKLHLRPEDAVFLTIAIFVGSVFNIPVRRIQHDRPVATHLLAVFGLHGALPGLGGTSRETVIAVNVGGCVIPTALAIYETLHIAALGSGPTLGLAAACAVNILLCWRIARPVAGVGILVPISAERALSTEFMLNCFGFSRVQVHWPWLTSGSTSIPRSCEASP
jgi:uncharacterized membrane protein